MNNFHKNPICQLLNIQYPIIQAGMVWCSGWELASAVSNSGGLGTIGSGSMYPEVLEQHLIKCQAATHRPFAVNLPLLYPQVDDHIDLIIKYQVPVVITSAGSPKKFTKRLQEHGITVGHVVSSTAFALKSQEAGVDFVIAEGFEAGGHNGREETTTFCLVPAVADVLSVPLVAAGGIYSGRSMLAAMVLGAHGVQVGSRFVTSTESSAHAGFKAKIVAAQEGDTKLSLKKLTPVRLLHNDFAQSVHAAELRASTAEELADLLGKGRAKKGMFEGDLEQGELEIGQCSAMISEILSAQQIITELLDEYDQSKSNLNGH